MDAGKFQLITEADLVLSRCGRFLPPVGSIVYIPTSFEVQAVLPTASNQTFYTEITGDTTFVLRAISFAQSQSNPKCSAQILKPDGHFLFSGLLDLIMVAGYGSGRFLLTKEIEIPPGSKIQLTLDDNFLAAADVQPVSVDFQGAFAYYLKGGRRSASPEQVASSLPRIFGGTNQNLLAPCWMGGVGPATPPGFSDSGFTYGDGISNVVSVTLGGTLVATASIQISDTEDFQVRRFLFDYRRPATVSINHGAFLMRIRLGSGYAVTDDYIDMAHYLGSAYSAKGLDVRRGDQIFFDLIFVDPVGTGNAVLEIFADGVKRRAI